MAITPNTDIRLIKTPFGLNNKNQLTFSNVNAQSSYFLSLAHLEVDNCSYQRKDNIIRYPAHIDDIIEYNYVMYKNENYSDKWFYAFITNMEYINDNLTNITIKTDVWQTWQFDIIYKDSFVEREHVNSDSIGEHTIDENLNVGEVIEESYQEDISLSENPYIAISSSYNPSTKKQFSGITVYNNQIFGDEIHLIATFPINNLTNFIDYLSKTNADGHIEDIKDVFLVPNALINASDLELQTGTIDGRNFTFYKLQFSEDVKEFTTNISKLTSFNDYTPKNNKLFCYPYNYLFVSNNIGNFNIYKYEDFENETNATFKNQLAMSIRGQLPTCSYKL